MITSIGRALGADAGDLGGHVEQRVGDLAGHHVDLVVEGDGDDHLGLLGAGLGQHVGVGAMADEAADVEIVADGLDQVRRGIDDRDVVVLGGQSFGDAIADLAGAADQYPHVPCGPRLRLADAKRLQLAMQRRTLHADELGGT
jgi:hypothetical protein